MIYYIYPIVLKYSRTSCLHAPFLGVLGFHKCFFNISSILSLSPHARNCSSHLMSTFVTLSSLVFTLSTTPQHHMNLLSSTSSRYKKLILILHPFFNFFLASSPHSWSQPRPISPSTPHFIVFLIPLLLVVCQFLFVLINIHQRQL